MKATKNVFPNAEIPVSCEFSLNDMFETFFCFGHFIRFIKCS